MNKDQKHAASFRDPNGFLFTYQGALYRQVNRSYQAHYDALMASGLYQGLVKSGKLIAHQEVDIPPAEPGISYRIIQPETLAFISYPYEWSFSQLKDAALLTLNIQLAALKKGLILKDASAYNIQFRPGDCRPVLIDSLSFEIYQEGTPWVAYRQFCQHFLAPLALMAYTDVRLSQLLRVYIDGIPLDLASHLLPRKTRFNFGLLSHIHLHASAQRRFSGETTQSSRQMSKTNLLALLDSLKRATQKLTWSPGGTEWGDYYEDTNYTPQALAHKQALVEKYIQRTSPKMVWDLGANNGFFSRLASQQGIPTLAFDIDPSAVEKNYLQIKAQKEPNLVPLLLDLTNPSPDIGWANQERGSLQRRTKPDLILALALIHHLAISNNVPLEMIAQYFSQLAPHLVIEFVPKTDTQVQRLLATREDIFPNYHREGFEAAFSRYYQILDVEAVQESQRSIYLLKTR